MGRRAIVTATSWLVAALALLWAVVPAGAQAGGPTISLSTTTAKPGAEVIVTLDNWDVGVVTISVCGNEARRGSPDCALRSAQSINTTSRVNPPVAQLIIERPPMPCPCVVRVANTGDDVVKTTPIVLTGVPTGPVIGPDQPGPLITVQAAITDSKSSLLERLRASLGGRARRTLELVVHNNGSTIGSHVTISAAVGRSRSSGESVTIPPVAPVAPGEVRAISAPLTLGAPTWGHYVVFGTIAGQGVPVNFTTSTSTSPVLLVILAFVLLADLAAMAWLRMARPTRRLPAGRLSPARAVVIPPPEQRVSSRETTREQLAQRAMGATRARSVPAVGAKKATPARPALLAAVAATNPRSRFFQSRKAMALSAAAALVLVVVVAVAARSSSTGGAAGTSTGGPSGAGAKSQTGARAGAAGSAGASGQGANGPTGTAAHGSPTTVAVGGALPARIDVKGATKAKDGQPVTLHVAADAGSLTYGIDARLCAGDAVIRFDADLSPLVAGKCVSKPLSPNTDDYVEIQAQAPFTAVDATFRVGVGTDHYTLRTGQPVTITCGPGHPCQIAVEVQYPNGFAIRTYPVTYG